MPWARAICHRASALLNICTFVYLSLHADNNAVPNSMSGRYCHIQRGKAQANHANAIIAKGHLLELKL